MKRNILFTTTYDHPIAKVWSALTTKEALSEWLMPCDFEAQVGHKFTFTTEPRPGFDGKVLCEVLELKQNETLSISWKAGKLDTVVNFNLVEKNGKTVLNFEQVGFESIMDRIIIRSMLAMGWKRTILSKLLPKYLSK